MKNNFTIMLDSIKNQVFGAENNLIDTPLDLDKLKSLYKLSVSHDLVHLVGASLINCKWFTMDNVAYDHYELQMLQAVSRYERIVHELSLITEILENEKIRFIPLKGAVLRRYYPEPWMRTSCDIDLFVDLNNVNIISELFETKLGYKPAGQWINEKSFESTQGVHVELHFLENTTNRTEIHVLDDVWENVKTVDGSNYRMEMTNEYFYMYHIAHMAKHFKNGGCGLRSFIDLLVMDKKMPYDKEKADELINSKGYYQFKVASARLANVWFENVEHDDLTLNMQEYVINGGIFGSKENWVVNQQAKKGSRKKTYI